MTTITTASGRTIDLFSPSTADIDIHDIAEHLSKLCRFTGACRPFWSVAQHSLLVSRLCHPDAALAGLLHDASEAYLGDVSSPLKHSPMMAGYRELEAEWEQAIGKAFGVELWRHHDEVKSADQKAFKLEHTGLLGWESSGGEVARAWAAARAVMPEMGLMEMDREKVRVLFVREFQWLGAKRKATVTP